MTPDQRSAFNAAEAGLVAVNESLRVLRESLADPAPVEPPLVTQPSMFGVFDDGTQGATWLHFNRVGNLWWANPGGDWIDAEGQRQGNVPLSSVTPKTAAWVELDMLPFMERWRVLNDGALLRGGKANVATREHADHALRPHMVVTTDKGAFVCPCVGDVRMASSTSSGIGTSPNMQIGQCLIRFDISSVVGVLQAAVARLYCTKNYGSDIGAYFINAPRPATETGAAISGIGAGKTLEVLRQHPDVVAVLDWAGDWQAVIGTPKAAPGGGVEVVDGLHYMRVQMPVDDTCSGGGEGTGFAASIPLAPVPASISPIPMEPMGPLSMFFRYAVRLGDDWTSEHDKQMTGGKFPGFAGRYGYPSSYGGRLRWNPTAGNGGTPGYGDYRVNDDRVRYASFRGWSARMQWQGIAQGQHTNQMRDTTSIGSYLYHPGHIVEGSGQERMWPNAQLQIGKLHEVEQFVQMNSIVGPFDQYGNGTAVADGVLRAWVDGVLVYEDTRFMFRRHPAIAIESAWLVFKNGGTLSPCLPHHLHLGPVVVSRSYIGPSRRSAR